MTDITRHDSSTSDEGAPGAEAPVRRPRRRAASRPAGPPAPTDEATSESPTSESPTAQTEAPTEPAAAPAKKAARKRAPRKTAATDEPTPLEPTQLEPTLLEQPTTGVPFEQPAAAHVGADDAAVAAKPARKRAARKSAAKAQPAITAPDPSDVVADDLAEPAVSPPPLAAPVLFQAPDPVAAPPRRRRRASAPAGPPVAHEELPAPVGPAPAAASDAAASDAAEDAPQEDADEAAGDGTGTGRKRRRRGGRGRRPRRDDEAASDTTSDTTTTEGAASTPAGDDESASQDDDSAVPGDDDEPGSASSRRRRRRRRRSGSGSGGGDGGGDSDTDENDDPGVVTRVRQPRKAQDEVASIRGSTRLEAKKQRRRDGREASRRKPTITESEFLARRESVQRTMVVRESAGRTQIAVLEDGVLVEHYVANETNSSMIGNVYLGRVQNVLPSMEAAFIDIGKGRNAVLYAGEVNWDAAGLDGQPRRIELALKSGDTVLAQVTKDPMGHKGARLTSQVSLPGRYLVYVPNSTMTGISRKLPDTERSRLKAILKEVVPEKAGVIVRTAAEGASEQELAQDVERLTGQWAEIEKKAAGTSAGSAPKLLYGEPDLTIRVVRDVFNEDFTSLVVSGEAAWGVVQPYLTHVAPDLADRVTRWANDTDVFVAHRIDEQLAKAMDRKVWLPSGGSLVIDRTEAMTVIDVNTGKFTGAGGNLEETVTRNNLEAAEEVVRQLRLRDIGGIIVVDFIDMVLEGNRDLVLRRLLECLGRDRTKHQVAEVTSLGLVQMTRKRVGQGLLEVFSEPCEHCAGRGVVVHSEPVESRAGGANGAESHSSAAGGGAGRSSGSASRRRGGRASEPAPRAVIEAPPRQPIPAGFVASLVPREEPAEPVVEIPAAPAEPVVENPAAPAEPAAEPVDEPAAPARRRRRASAPTGPPVVHE